MLTIMFNGKLRLLFLLAFLATLSIIAPHEKALAEEGCITAQCHSTLLGAKNIHPAAESCDNCHQSQLTPHPQAKIKTFRLSQEPPDLCATCHEPFGKKTDIHPPVKDGMCTSCHNPHASDVPKLLLQPVNDLCLTCHFEMSEIIDKSKTVHAPIKTEKGCVSCHSPHESDHDKLLLKTGKELCLECHKNIIKKSMTVLHGPINSGTCTACHNPHGSPEARLLIKSFPSDLYVPYTETTYELCFTCHKRELLSSPNTSSATGFRDGDVNLHFLHVNREKGRSCKVCHDLHGSALPKLINATTPFSQWQLPLNFEKTDTGGSCTPGCHKTYYYDRITPGKGPSAVKPGTK
ncbi:MAG: cytochrome c3 family protein [Nitrospirota bacterium]